MRGGESRERSKATAPNQAWSLDFVADQLADGRRFRALTIVDVFTRESLAIEAGPSLKGADVVRVLSRIWVKRATPKTLFCDNGSELPAKRWICGRIRPECRSIFRGRASRPTTRTWNRSTGSFDRRAWMRIVRHTGGSQTGDRSVASRI